MASFLLDASITTMSETASVNGLEVSEMDREGAIRKKSELIMKNMSENRLEMSYNAYFAYL